MDGAMCTAKLGILGQDTEDEEQGKAPDKWYARCRLRNLRQPTQILNRRRG